MSEIETVYGYSVEYIRVVSASDIPLQSDAIVVLMTDAHWTNDASLVHAISDQSGVEFW